MRFLAIGLAAAVLTLPVPASAAGAHSAKAATVDYAAKKKAAKHHARMKKEKVEYMRAAPMRPGAK